MHYCYCRHARIAELEARQVPEGWRLVPIEPTDKMVMAAISTAHTFGDMGQAAKNFYTAMHPDATNLLPKTKG